MRSAVLSTAAMVLAGIQSVQAQTFSACNPMKGDKCPPNPALGSTVFYDFTKTQSLPADFSALPGTTPDFSPEEGLRFVINTNTNAPTIAFTKYIMYGKVEAYVKASQGPGIVSSVILLSDVLDEIDWEWTGSSNDHVQSNFFGKSNTTLYNREQHLYVGNPLNSVQKYTIEWTETEITWTINDDPALSRTLPYGGGDMDLTNGGNNYPQTPMQVKLGNWVGCPSKECFEDASCPTHGTCQWAGGYFGQDGPGPYVMSITNLTISDYSCGTDYSYGDNTGMAGSIRGASKCDGSTTKTVTQGGSTSSTKSVPQSSGTAAPLNLGQGNATVTSGSAQPTGGKTVPSTPSKAPSDNTLGTSGASGIQAQFALAVLAMGAAAAALL